MGRSKGDDRGCLYAAADKLTPTEKTVLNQLIDYPQATSNQDIADRLRISKRTIETHMSNVLLKLGVYSREGAAVVWMQLKFNSIVNQVGIKHSSQIDPRAVSNIRKNLGGGYVQLSNVIRNT